MNSLKLFSLHLFLNCVAFEGVVGIIVKQCEVGNVECYQDAIQHFVAQTSTDAPELGLRPLDPLVVEIFDLWPLKDRLKLCFENLTLTGLKNAKISYFQNDDLIEDAKRIKLSLLITIDAAGRIRVESPELDRVYIGQYNAKQTAVATAYFRYEVKSQDKGIKYFDISPSYVTCEPLTIPEFEMNKKLELDLQADPTAKELVDEYNLQKVSHKQKMLCKMIELAVSVLMDDMRIAAQHVPSNIVFKYFKKVADEYENRMLYY